MNLTALALAAAAASAAASPTDGGATAAPRMVRCLLIAPLENESDSPDAAATANEVLYSSDAAARGRALDEPDLRGLFADSSLELPDGIPPPIAFDLAEILGADGVLFGSVSGTERGPSAPLRVDLKLALPGSRSIVRAASAAAVPRPGEAPAAALRRAAAEAGAAATVFVGGPPLPGCFDPARLAHVRQAALAAGPGGAAPRAAAAPASPRQADWSSRLAAGTRFPVEGIAFEGRTARIARAAGLEDLAAALRTTPGVRLRLEGFVDSTGRSAADVRLSLSMAQAAAERLVALGIPLDRISWTGRGGDAPILPNFTARGRARNRRVEAVPLVETASRP